MAPRRRERLSLARRAGRDELQSGRLLAGRSRGTWQLLRLDVAAVDQVTGRERRRSRGDAVVAFLERALPARPAQRRGQQRAVADELTRQSADDVLRRAFRRDPRRRLTRSHAPEGAAVHVELAGLECPAYTAGLADPGECHLAAR